MKRLGFVLSILLCILFFFILEVVSYNFLYGPLGKDIKISDALKSNHSLYRITPPDILDFDILLPQRNDETLAYDDTKKPILLLGCSYTYGQGIDINKNFSSQLQKRTKRKVVNVSDLEIGAEECLKNLAFMERHNILQEKQFEYVIYTQMHNHVYRIYDLGMFANYLFENYKQNKNNSFKDKLIYCCNFSYTVKLLNCKAYTLNNNIKWRFDYLKYQIKKMNEILKRTLPNSKFIVLLYDDITNSDVKQFETENEKFDFISLNKSNYLELSSEDIYIISTKDLVGDILYKEEFQLKTDKFQRYRPHHPNEKAWQMIVPQLCKNLNI